MTNKHQRQLAVRAMRGKMWSPGRPSTTRREDRVRFWEEIARPPRPAVPDHPRRSTGRLLMIERAGQGCAIGSVLFERIHQPYIREGQRTGALRFGDQRAMALTGALCCFVHAVAGFTNKSLRVLVAGVLGRDYTSSQMTYDLRRLLHGLIGRIPRTNTLRAHA